MVLLLDHTTDAGENKRPALLTKGMRDGNRGIVENPSEQVGVGAGVYELQYKSMVVLQPNQKPIGLQMTFPIAGILARQFVWAILRRQFA